jgi:hypothetical protein
MCAELTGKAPPPWVNRLARIAVMANQCAPCILPASVRAVAATPSMAPLGGFVDESEDESEDDAPLLRTPQRPTMSKLSNRTGRA